MKLYTVEELSNTETYTNDQELATFTRKICAITHVDGSMPFGEWKRQYLAGKHPEHVFKELTERIAADDAKAEEASKAFFKKNEKIRKALETLTLPTGCSIEGQDGGKIILKAEWDGGDLAKRLKRVGAEWSRERKAFEIPLDAAPSLGRILANWRKEQDGRNEQKAQEEKKKQAQWEKDQIERDALRAKEKREREAVWAAQKKEQAKAVADRILVTVGQYKVGDMVEGKPITGFGKQWSEGSLSMGQLYQPCDYGRCEEEPVCVACFKCAKHCRCGEQIAYCYAYFS